MSEEKKRQIAKEYIDRQLDTMRAHNSAPEISDEEYQGLISEAAELVEA